MITTAFPTPGPTGMGPAQQPDLSSTESVWLFLSLATALIVVAIAMAVAGRRRAVPRPRDARRALGRYMLAQMMWFGAAVAVAAMVVTVGIARLFGGQWWWQQAPVWAIVWAVVVAVVVFVASPLRRLPEPARLRIGNIEIVASSGSENEAQR